MRRALVLLLTTSLLFALLGAEALAGKRSRSNRASVEARREARSKSPRARGARRKSRRGRTRYASRGRRGRRSRRVAQPVDAAASSRPAPGIPTERVTEIQNALIKAGYLDAPPSGQYDELTVGAMKEFQATHKLSQTGLPSALALKKLGVSKRSSDGYAVPVTSISEKKP